MFAKPYKHKSVNTLKNSEKKHLAQRVQDEFSLASEEKAKELVPVKGSCVCMKVVLNSGDTVNVYAVDSVPLLIETAERLVPTVCALWRVPDLVPVLTIHTPVFPKVQGGAPLYLPGVSLPAGGVGFPIFQVGQTLAVKTEDNSAACIVGRATMSSADMLLRASGICLDTLHFYGDHLCKDDKFGKIERPKLGPARKPIVNSTVNLAADVQQLSLQPVREEWPALGGSRPPPPAPANPAPAPTFAPNEPALIPSTEVDIGIVHEDVDEDGIVDDTDTAAAVDAPPDDMDERLRWTLLRFLKLHGKTLELPLKTNILYKNHLQPLCPAERPIEVKKSSYKKLSKFLEAMQQEGLVEVREVERGVDALVAAHAQHPLVRAHRSPAPAPAAAPSPAGEYAPPRVRELLCVTAPALPVLAPHKKGAALTPAEVREAVTEYVRARSLASGPGVVLDDPLARVVGASAAAQLSWEALLGGVRARMTPATELRFADGSVRLTRARLQPVTMQVLTRSGNKKVTLVSHLESFGFSLGRLARECQHAVAGACGVTRAPGAAADQLMLQGDQTHFVAKLLIEKYGLPKKYVEGADKALNKKK